MAGELTPLQRDVIVRLSLDPTNQKKGYEDAKRIQANASAEMLAIDVQRQRLRGQLEGTYTRDFLDATKQRIASLDHELAVAIGGMRGKSAAEKSAAIQSVAALRDQRAAQVEQIQNYQKVQQQLAQLNVQYRQQAALAKEAQIAAKAIGPGAGGFWQQFGDVRALRGFTAAGALQFVGLGAAATGLPTLLKSIAEGLRGAAISGAEYAHNLSLISEKTGIAIPELQKFEAVGKVSGLSLDDLVIATRRFSAAIVGGEGIAEGLEGGSQRGAQAIKALGISVRDTATGQLRPMSAVLGDLAEVFARTPNGAEKARIAVELFGRSGLNLIPLLNLGRKGFEEITAAVDKYIPSVTDLKKRYEEYELAGAKSEASTTKLKVALEDILPIVIKSKEHWADLKNAIAEAVAGSFELPTGEKLTKVGREFFRARGEIGPPLPGEPGVSSVLTGAGRAAAVTHAVDEARKKNEEILARFEREKLAFEDAHKKNDKEEMDRIVERVRKLQDELLIDRDIVQELRKQNDELGEAAKAAAGLRDKEAERFKQYEKVVAEHEKAIAKATSTGGLALAEEQLKAVLTPRGLLANREQSALNRQAQLLTQEAALRSQGLSAEDALVENLKQQAELEHEIWKIRVERVQLAEKDKKETAELFAKMDEVANKEIKELRALQESDPLFSRLFARRGPAAPLGAQPVEGFVEQIERLNAQSQAGVISTQQQIDAHKGIIAALQAETIARLKNQDMSDADVKALAKINNLLREQVELLKQTEKLTPFGRFVSLFKEFSGIIGKFSGGLSGMFSNVFAGIEAVVASLSQLQVAGGGVQQKPGGPVIGGSFMAGLKSLFSGKGGLFGVLSGFMSLLGAGFGFAGAISPFTGRRGFANPAMGVLSGAVLGALPFVGLAGLGAATGVGSFGSLLGAMAGGPIMLPVIAAMAVLGGVKGSKTKRNRRAAQQAADEFKKTMKEFNEGAKGIAETIKQLEADRAKAVASMRGGKHGNQQQVQQTIDQIDAALADLRRRQKEILDNFKLKVGLFSLPEEYRDVASAIADIAKQLKEAGDAGASAADKVKFLNGAMADLKVKIGRDLRDEEQQTFDLLKQGVDLQEQRKKVLEDSAKAELNVKRSLGLAPALTPAQQAAQQLKDIRKQRDEQLKQIDEQQATLKAQLTGRAELFGWSLKDLDVAGAREKILARQLELERSITAETIARIRAQQDLFAQLAAGHIPTLPPGVLPPGFSFPTGGTYTYTFAPGSVVIHFPRTPTNPREFARIVREGFRNLNDLGTIGSGV